MKQGTDKLNWTEAELDADRDERLARFGDKAGRHGPLAAVTVPLNLRVPRESALRLMNLGRAVGMRRNSLAAYVLNTLSHVEADRFANAIAALQKAGGARGMAPLE